MARNVPTPCIVRLSSLLPLLIVTPHVGWVRRHELPVAAGIGSSAACAHARPQLPARLSYFHCRTTGGRSCRSSSSRLLAVRPILATWYCRVRYPQHVPHRMCGLLSASGPVPAFSDCGHATWMSCSYTHTQLIIYTYSAAHAT